MNDNYFTSNFSYGVVKLVLQRNKSNSETSFASVKFVNVEK